MKEGYKSQATLEAEFNFAMYRYDNWRDAGRNPIERPQIQTVLREAWRSINEWDKANGFPMMPVSDEFITKLEEDEIFLYDPGEVNLQTAPHLKIEQVP